jgi:hypothetical protein
VTYNLYIKLYNQIIQRKSNLFYKETLAITKNQEIKINKIEVYNKDQITKIEIFKEKVSKKVVLRKTKIYKIY